jgi:hypothetical protein
VQMDRNENGMSHRSGIIQEATDKFHERKESGKTMVDRVRSNLLYVSQISCDVRAATNGRDQRPAALHLISIYPWFVTWWPDFDGILTASRPGI